MSRRWWRWGRVRRLEAAVAELEFQLTQVRELALARERELHEARGEVGDLRVRLAAADRRQRLLDAEHAGAHAAAEHHAATVQRARQMLAVLAGHGPAVDQALAQIGAVLDGAEVPR